MKGLHSAPELNEKNTALPTSLTSLGDTDCLVTVTLTHGKATKALKNGLPLPLMASSLSDTPVPVQQNKIHGL